MTGMNIVRARAVTRLLRYRTRWSLMVSQVIIELQFGSSVEYWGWFYDRRQSPLVLILTWEWVGQKLADYPLSSSSIPPQDCLSGS